MAEIVQGGSSAIPDLKENSGHHSLTYKVFVKSLVDIEKFSNRFIDLKNHLNVILDEPVVFVVQNRDRKSKEAVAALNFPCVEMSLKEIRSLNKRNVIVLFILGEPTKKAKKIIEIICNENFHKSILLV